MTNPITDSLLDQAKRQLASNDFENAAKSARAVLALDSENSDATDILKASEAAIGNGSSNDESVTKTELKLIAVQVQAAINSVEWAKAEDLITQYLVEYPDIPDAQKILRDVQKARGKYILQHGPIQRPQQQPAERSEIPSISITKGHSAKIYGLLVVCFLLWGFFGGHRIYAGRWASGLLMLLALFITIIWFNSKGFNVEVKIAVAGLLLWQLVDLFMILTKQFTDSRGNEIG